MKTPLIVVAIIVAISSALAAPVTNTDIEKLVAAGMSDEIILNVIASGDPLFDTSADALIRLKDKGASPAVLAALTNRSKHPANSPATAPTPTEQYPNNLDRVVLVAENGQQIALKYNEPESRVAGKLLALAFGSIDGGTHQYWVLQGASADVRSPAKSPTFVVSVPAGSRPEQVVQLTSWTPRSKKTREILISAGHFDLKISNSEMVHEGPQFPKDRIVEIEFKEVAKPKSGSSFADQYFVTPRNVLRAGEYALIVGAQVYDFGIDE